MSGDDPIVLVGIEILKMLGSFIFGLLMRKSVGRFFIKAIKRLSNDFINITFISTRIYDFIEHKSFDMGLFHEIQKRIPALQIESFSQNNMQIKMPHFGIMNIIFAPSFDGEEEVTGEIKVSLVMGNKLRLGVREMDLVHDYYHNTEQVFQVVEGVFLERPKMKRNYILAEISRVGGFLEEKTFEIDDEDLSAHIHATSSKITIAAEPPIYIAKAVKKYLLV